LITAAANACKSAIFIHLKKNQPTSLILLIPASKMQLNSSRGAKARDKSNFLTA